ATARISHQFSHANALRLLTSCISRFIARSYRSSRSRTSNGGECTRRFAAEMEKLAAPHWFDSQTTARREPKRAKIANGARDRSGWARVCQTRDGLSTTAARAPENRRNGHLESLRSSAVTVGASLSTRRAAWFTFTDKSLHMIPKLSKILILTVCLASVSLADDFKTFDGKEYKNAKVSRVEPDGIVITFSGGIVKLPFAELSPEVQKRYGFDPIAEEKRRAEQEALEDKQVEEQKAVAREQAEGEKNAEADLTQSREQSQAAEQRAAQTYRSAPKGTLSGQVFVSA